MKAKDPRQELFNHLQNEHDLTCLETDMDEIITIVNRMYPSNAEGAKEDLFEKAKNALEKYILENPDKVAQDLDVMRALQTTPPQANTVTDEDQLFNFFVWFRANGENHTDKPIEKMIEIYLSQQPEPRERLSNSTTPMPTNK